MLVIHGIFSVVCYVIFITFFMGIFCQERELSKTKKTCIVLGMVLFFTLWITCLYDHLAIKIVGQFVFYSLCLWGLYDVKYLKALVFTIIFFCGCGVTDYLILLLIMNVMPEGSLTLLESPLGSSLVEVLSEGIHLLILIVMMRCFKKQDSELLTTKEWLRFIIGPVISIVIITVLMVDFDIAQNEKQEAAFLMIAIGLVVMNIIVYFLLHDVLKREAALREDRIFKTRAEREIQMYHSLSDNYEKQKRIQHEYKNRMDSISALVREEKYKELNQYLNSLNQELSELVDVIDVNNVMINALLNAKYQEMREKGIILIPQINDLSQIPVSDEDIVVILVNLLNNAIEACEHSDKKIIKLKFVCDEDRVILSVINTYAQAPIMNGDKFKTTKTDSPELHGIGIHNVKEMVAKYGGQTVIKVTEQEFRFVIFIPQKKTV
ncbi:MAG: sensor histidine kinase [Lachnospiraceae bacterium]|nr:sensor histidine kinase [Lachnospiraceae bacterium]